MQDSIDIKTKEKERQDWEDNSICDCCLECLLSPSLYRECDCWFCEKELEEKTMQDSIDIKDILVENDSLKFVIEMLKVAIKSLQSIEHIDRETIIDILQENINVYKDTLDGMFENWEDNISEELVMEYINALVSEL